MNDANKAFAELKKHKRKLQKKQIQTLNGQIKCGEINAAMKGLQTILSRRAKRGKTAKAD